VEEAVALGLGLAVARTRLASVVLPLSLGGGYGCWQCLHMRDIVSTEVRPAATTGLVVGVAVGVATAGCPPAACDQHGPVTSGGHTVISYQNVRRGKEISNCFFVK